MAGINGSDIVVLIILALLVALVVWRLWKGRKTGNLSCGGCTGCSAGGSDCCGSAADRKAARRIEHMSDAELQKLHQAALAQRNAEQQAKPTQSQP
ncbi:FeoB-associated Cys-rich membrane protein [Oscillospiraceae bacterium HV4-5-C5C]|nr:FeoB-associated Cys-rich membrane protein [Oscillospiraceae bacterium HV4-5-C5C]